MRTVVFDLDETVFKSETTLHDDVRDLLGIISRLGMRIGALSNADHRVLVRLEEAGIRHHFSSVVCAAHIAEPKTVDGIMQLIERLGSEPEHVVIVSHRTDDLMAGKEAGVAKTIYVVHGPVSAKHASRHADHIVQNIATVLDVLE